jgi:hypothetical protein
MTLQKGSIVTLNCDLIPNLGKSSLNYLSVKKSCEGTILEVVDHGFGFGFFGATSVVGHDYQVEFEISQGITLVIVCSDSQLNEEVPRVRHAKKEDLPLFIGQLKTQEGKDELERRLKTYGPF